MSFKDKLRKYCASQVSQLKDSLIKVDKNDSPLGEIDKLTAHLDIPENNTPHRAFSVFLFDDKNRLLLQERSSKKITFPSLWTNTCCSHPRYNEAEREEKDNLGIKVAANRRLEFEFNISVPASSFKAHERILYFAKDREEFIEHEGLGLNSGLPINL